MANSDEKSYDRKDENSVANFAINNPHDLPAKLLMDLSGFSIARPVWEEYTLYLWISIDTSSDEDIVEELEKRLQEAGFRKE